MAAYLDSLKDLWPNFILEFECESVEKRRGWKGGEGGGRHPRSKYDGCRNSNCPRSVPVKMTSCDETRTGKLGGLAVFGCSSQSSSPRFSPVPTKPAACAVMTSAFRVKRHGVMSSDQVDSR